MFMPACVQVGHYAAARRGRRHIFPKSLSAEEFSVQLGVLRAAEIYREQEDDACNTLALWVSEAGRQGTNRKVSREQQSV